MTEMAGQQRLIDEEIVSYNPATLEELGRVKVTPPEDLDGIVAEAAAAQRRWAERSPADRARVIGRAADYLLANGERYAELITKENGKTIVESTYIEVLGILDTFRYVERHAAKVLAPERIPTPQLFFKNKRHFFVYEPIGVVGIIAPWNYPFLIPASETAIALAAGNAVVLKPAPLTPLIGNAIADVFRAAGLPQGLLHVIHGDADTGGAMCEHDGIGKILFTGSVEVGYKVAQACAKRLKPYVLELGGKDAAIVMADADLDRAARGILWGGAANCGQTCSGIERVYVDKRVYQPFLDKITTLAEALVPGDPMSVDTQVGPFTTADQYAIVEKQMSEATSKGARTLTGGPAEVGLPGKFYAPAIVTGVDHSMALMRDETFGPVVPVMPVDGPDEAIRLANDSTFGLGGSVWTRNVKIGRKVAGKMEAGSVWINDHMYSYAAAQLPWGGVKKSGVGRTHSKYGFSECCHVKMVSEDSGRLPVAWWHPYDERLRSGLQTAAKALYSGNRLEGARAALAGRGALKALLDRARDIAKGRQ
jgi:succinate-semialdehyde dehydrogenase/glutarate-semialdehyde dehydrogenase